MFLSVECSFCDSTFVSINHYIYLQAATFPGRDISPTMLVTLEVECFESQAAYLQLIPLMISIVTRHRWKVEGKPL